MRVLWLVTKPPIPAVDGGCVVTARTIAALDDAGVRGTVVAPAAVARVGRLGSWRVVEVRAPGGVARLGGLLRTGSVSTGRHVRPAVARAVERELAGGPFDVLHCEQIHALPQCEPARRRNVPIVLRAQNVERDALAARSRASTLLRWEVRRVAAFETAAVRSAAATVALTAADAARLTALAGTPVVCVPPPFPSLLEPGAPLAGAPAVVLFGSAGWFPNRDGAAWFVARVWPAVRARLPGARLHVVGLPCAPGPGVVRHPAPADSRTAFPRDAVLVAPSRVATGVRMKVLEAWARGVPVVATPEAAVGLDPDGLLVAADGASFADAVARLHADRALATRLVASGRTALRRDHDPSAAAAALVAVYARVSGAARPRGRAAAARRDDPRGAPEPGA